MAEAAPPRPFGGPPNVRAGAGQVCAGRRSGDIQSEAEGKGGGGV